MSQVERRNAHRRRLLSKPCETVEATPDPPLVYVTVEGKILVPSFQLGEHGEPRTDLLPALWELSAAGITGWEAWTWLTSATGWLSGETPEQAARANPERTVRAFRNWLAT